MQENVHFPCCLILQSLQSGVLLFHEPENRPPGGKEMRMAQFRVGDPVVYHKPKSSTSPGPRARDVYPLANGDQYHYVVDKYWRVTSVNEDGTIDVATRTGKKHRLPANDPNICRPHPLKMLMYRKRFPG
jgi:hypothetical protein